MFPSEQFLDVLFKVSGVLSVKHISVILSVSVLVLFKDDQLKRAVIPLFEQRHRFCDRNNLRSDLLKLLCELADMLEIVRALAAVELDVRVVDIPANHFFGSAIGEFDSDPSAVRHSELLIVSAVDEPDPVLGQRHVFFQPVSPVGPDVNVVVPFRRVQPEEVRILFRVDSEPVPVFVAR